MINVVCVLKESKLYNAEWVYKLERSIKRNLSLPYNFLCLSTIPLSCNYILLDNNTEGWWNKLQLFKPNLLTNETIYFDLDVIISKPIDLLIKNLRGQDKNFLMSLEPPNISNSSIMYWRGDFSELYIKYKENPEYYHTIYRKGLLVGDQALISKNIDHDFINNYLPKNYISWCKEDSINVDNNTGFLIFLSKKCKPNLFADHQFIKENWG
jgi:hypothetical protein